MIILAFDSSVNACSVALWQDGAVLFSQSKEMLTGQAEALLPMIATAIKTAGINPKDLSVIATTIGPGSFTGIRISISAAKALGLALDIPVIGVTTLEAFARSFKSLSDYQYFGVVVDTKRNDFYFQLFDAKALPVSEMFYKTAQDISEYIKNNKTGKIPVIGDGVNRLLIENNNDDLFKIENCDIIYPQAIKIAEIANDKIAAKNDCSSLIKPLYLRPPDVSFAK